MVSFMIWMVVIVAVVGLLAKAVVPALNNAQMFQYNDKHISWSEYGIALLVIAFIVAPSVYWLGDKYSINEQLEYQEFYNGVETDATSYVTQCRPGRKGTSRSVGHSNCEYEYVIGSYTWTTETCTTDKDGNQHCTTHWHRADLYAPYLERELTYKVFDTLGGETRVGGTYAPEDRRPYNANVAVPDSIPTGPPAEWQLSRERLDAGDPRPVTRVFTYDNFILAADQTQLLPYADPEAFLAEHPDTLPDHTANINDDPVYGYNNGLATKIHFVGVEAPGGEERWTEAVNGFNGALGMTLQGDLHMVVIDDSLVDSPVRYTETLKTYWSSEYFFGRRTIAKNAIIVVVGVSNGEVIWAEATTGMPYGNEVMLESIAGRIGREDPAFTPEAIIGNPRLKATPYTNDEGKQRYESEVLFAENPGILEEVVFKQTPFQRASMSCNDKEDGENCIGFSHLVNKLSPSTGVKVVMTIAVVIVSFILWSIAAAIEMTPSAYQERERKRRESRYRRPYRSRYY